MPFVMATERNSPNQQTPQMVYETIIGYLQYRFHIIKILSIFTVIIALQQLADGCNHPSFQLLLQCCADDVICLAYQEILSMDL